MSHSSPPNGPAEQLIGFHTHMSVIPHVSIRGVSKRFGGTTALDAVSVEIDHGTVHAFIGENGAGKSTLGKLIAGVHQADSGDLLLAGRPVSFRSPRQALDAGVTIVAQELSLVPGRSVIENVFLGREPHVGPVVQKRALRRRFDELIATTGIELPPDEPIGNLSIALQQKVEILRALARSAQLIVMDEPTARLTAHEAEALCGTVRGLARDGTTILFVSHFLDEVLGVSDTVTIMRDGRVVRTNPTGQETRSSLIEGMIGRKLEASFPQTRPVPAHAAEVLAVSHLTRPGVFEDVSFSVRAGEILVFAGLVGSGRTEVARAIFGADTSHTGTVILDGAPLARTAPWESIEHGLAMIPEDRKAQGLQQTRSVRENVTISHLRSMSRWGVIKRRFEDQTSSAVIARVGVRTASQESPVSSLSGGNQQKVLFARTLLKTARVLIADEPTRGVDVGAKRAIYDLLAELAADGMAVLVVSSEIEEVIGLAHRVMVMRAGRIVSELQGDGITEANIIHAAFGAVPDFESLEEQI